MNPDQDSQFLLHVLGIKIADDLPALLQPEAVKEKTFEIFRQLAVRGSQRRPLILVLEDLHWVDPCRRSSPDFWQRASLTPAS